MKKRSRNIQTRKNLDSRMGLRWPLAQLRELDGPRQMISRYATYDAQFQPKLFSAMTGALMPCSRTLRLLLLPALFLLPRPVVGEVRPLAPDMKYPPMPPDTWLMAGPVDGTEVTRWCLRLFWR